MAHGTETEPVKRIAMWSGPRNISTAMMRAWENREDTAVVDEPFYACYLKATGIVHPMQQEILGSQASSWRNVIDIDLKMPLAPGVKIQYQKHMAQHMVDDIDHNWFKTLKHAFLIRHPAEVIVSYEARRKLVAPEDLGFSLQHKIYQLALALGMKNIPIIDAKDVLNRPQKMLSNLCQALEVRFDPAMLCWPQGPRASDGVWAPHWYQNVEKSTGFGVYFDKHLKLTAAQQAVVDECLPYYTYLYERRIR
ncbi:MAG: HAD family hydrolase [Gammaproteobacteria bacterium]|nr:HAD family hydrolase [Gammaproteobacteria bacterium]